MLLTLYSFNAILNLYQNKQNKRTYVTKIKKSTELKRIYGQKCRLGQKFCSLLPRVILGYFCIYYFLYQDGVIRGGGGHSPVAGSSDIRLCAQQKHKPHLSPHYRRVGQEYWQSLSYLPSAAQAGSDKIKANE